MPRCPPKTIPSYIFPPRRKNRRLRRACALHFHRAPLFRRACALEDDEIGKWMRSLDTADRGEHAQRVISDANPQWNSMLRDTISPTMLTAGVRANVIPAEARATLNIRLLPGDTIDALLGELNKLVNDPLVKLEVEPNAGLAAPPSSLENDFYASIVKVAAQEFGGVPVLPVSIAVGYRFRPAPPAQRAVLRSLAVPAGRRRPPPHARQRRAHPASVLRQRSGGGSAHHRRLRRRIPKVRNASATLASLSKLSSRSR